MQAFIPSIQALEHMQKYNSFRLTTQQSIFNVFSWQNVANQKGAQSFTKREGHDLCKYQIGSHYLYPECSMKWAAAHNSANPAPKNWPVPDASSNVSLSLFPCTYLKNLPKQDLKKKTTNCRNCNGLIFVLVHFRWKSRYHCLLHSAHFLLEFAQLSLRRRVVSVSHYFTVYIYI